MNTDREFLELAAKAAGIETRSDEHGLMTIAQGPFQIAWNPLQDDGDALRLAVMISQRKGLRLMLPEFNDAWAVVDDYSGDFKVREIHESDPYAATRRAIVRAAAEIGRHMQEGGAA